MVNSQLQLIFFTVVAMAKESNKKSSNVAGLLKKVDKPNPKQKEKQRELHSQKFSKYQIKKAEEQQPKDTMACQPTPPGGFGKDGNASGAAKFRLRGPQSDLQLRPRARPHHQPPIQTIDASVAPPEVTLYPEYPRLEFSSPPALTFTVTGRSR